MSHGKVRFQREGSEFPGHHQENVSGAWKEHIQASTPQSFPGERAVRVMEGLGEDSSTCIVNRLSDSLSNVLGSYYLLGGYQGASC